MVYGGEKIGILYKINVEITLSRATVGTLVLGGGKTSGMKEITQSNLKLLKLKILIPDIGLYSITHFSFIS